MTAPKSAGNADEVREALAEGVNKLARVGSLNHLDQQYALDVLLPVVLAYGDRRAAEALEAAADWLGDTYYGGKPVAHGWAVAKLRARAREASR